MKRVAIGLSGGVDSATSVALLQKQGYEVVGITFKFIDNFDEEDSVMAAKTLGIEHHIIDYRKEFKEKVLNKFITDYSNGITPNPCVICNKEAKMNFLYQEMKKLNCDYIATGHYAKIKDGHLYKSKDESKDQTYFLCQVPKEILSRLILPLEGLEKSEVRKIASNYNLSAASKKDSTDVCFLGNKSLKEFLMDFIPSKPGDVVNIDTNEVIGKHLGLMNYTIGQRKGLNIGGTEDKMFVAGKDLKNNILYICLGEGNSNLISTSCLVDNVNYLADEKVTKCTAKFRYRQKEVEVELEWINDKQVIVKYPQGVKSVTPGQACVFYNHDECLGGGIIKEVIKDDKKIMFL